MQERGIGDSLGGQAECLCLTGIFAPCCGSSIIFNSHFEVGGAGHICLEGISQRPINGNRGKRGEQFQTGNHPDVVTTDPLTGLIDRPCLE